MSRDTSVSNWNAARYAGVAEEKPEGLNSHKAVLGVVLVDERGEATSFQLSHLYRCYRDGEDLVAEFTGHRVRLSGTGLFAPVHTSLMMLLTLHKRDLVCAVPGGSERDFGLDGSEKWQVTGIKVEGVEA